MATRGFHQLTPAEYVSISAVLAGFAGLTLLLVTRDLILGLIVAASVFVVVILALAMLILAMTPNETPEGQKEAPGTGND